jgi:hypothetical protein
MVVVGLAASSRRTINNAALEFGLDTSAFETIDLTDGGELAIQ